MNKRLLITTIAGLVCGIIDWQIVAAMLKMWGYPLPVVAGISIAASITIVGIAIGISTLNKFDWWLHGIIIALVFTLPRTLGNIAWGWTSVAYTLVTVIIFGVLIELCATILFSAPMKGKKGL